MAKFYSISIFLFLSIKTKASNISVCRLEIIKKYKLKDKVSKLLILLSLVSIIDIYYAGLSNKNLEK